MIVTLRDFEATKMITYDMEVLRLENERMILYNALKKAFNNASNDDKKRLCRVYLYETKAIDKRLSEIRFLLLHRTT